MIPERLTVAFAGVEYHLCPFEAYGIVARALRGPKHGANGRLIAALTGLGLPHVSPLLAVRIARYIINLYRQAARDQELRREVRLSRFYGFPMDGLSGARKLVFEAQMAGLEAEDYLKDHGADLGIAAFLDLAKRAGWSREDAEDAFAQIQMARMIAQSRGA